MGVWIQVGCTKGSLPDLGKGYVEEEGQRWRAIGIPGGVGKIAVSVMGSQKMLRDEGTQGEVERRPVDSVLQEQAVKYHSC